LDQLNSPGIDGGRPDSAVPPDWDIEPDPDGERINQGAYGGTEQASKYDLNPPTVTKVWSTLDDADKWYWWEEEIPITVTFSEVVLVTGAPLLTLETGSNDRQAYYSSGSGTTELTFIYTVHAEDYSPDLDYLDEAALTLNGATIRDRAPDGSQRNHAMLTLPSPGAAGSLRANENLKVDAARPC